MKKHTLLLQITAFIIYLLNHIGHFYFIVLSNKPHVKTAFIVFLAVVVLLFMWDYQFNYRKKLKFVISPFLFLYYGTVMWFLDGVYYLTVLNLILLSLFIVFSRKLASQD